MCRVGLVPARAWSTDALTHVVGGEQLTIGGAGVLDTTIGVVDQSGLWTASPQGHVQGGRSQLGSEVIGHCPAHHRAAVRIENDGQVQPPLPGADVRDVAEPQLIWCTRVKLPLHQVFGLDFRVGDRRATEALRWSTGQPGLAHQASHTLARDPLASSTKFGMHAWRSVCTATSVVHGSNLFGQRNIRLGTSRWSTMQPGVVAAGRYLQHATQLSDRVVRLRRRDEPIAAHRVVSLKLLCQGIARRPFRVGTV